MIIQGRTLAALNNGGANSTYFVGLAAGGAIAAALVAAASRDAEMTYGPVATVEDVAKMDSRIANIEVCHANRQSATTQNIN